MSDLTEQICHALFQSVSLALLLKSHCKEKSQCGAFLKAEVITGKAKMHFKFALINQMCKWTLTDLAP
jgi:hypothetical protein